MSVISAPSIDSATWWLNASNALYIIGSGFTVITALFVLYEAKAVADGKRAKFYLASEIATAVCAAVSLTGSFGAIHYGNVLSSLKDADLTSYKRSADIKIAQARLDAATAYEIAAKGVSDAGHALRESEATQQQNLKLKIELAKHESAEKKTEAEQAAKNQQLTQATQGLAQEQRGMAKQMQAVPTLSSAQEDAVADQMREFAGKNIPIHSVMDAHAQRFADALGRALAKAGITTKDSMSSTGVDYQGVEIVVKNREAAKIPPIGRKLYIALRAVGIPSEFVYDNSMPSDEDILVEIGPE